MPRGKKKIEEELEDLESELEENEELEDTTEIEETNELENTIESETTDETKEDEEEEIEEEISNELEEIEEENELNESIDKMKKIALYAGIGVLVITLIVFVIMLISNSKKPDKKEETLIERPVDIEVSVLNKNGFTLTCRDKDDDKIYKLKNGMEVNCKLSFEFYSSTSLNELYVDINTSNNLELLDYDSEDNSCELSKYKNLFKLEFSENTSSFENGITLKYKVTDSKEKAYVELDNILFKDQNDAYYKTTSVLANLPEIKEDKVYFYKYPNKEDKDKYLYAAYKYQLEEEQYKDYELIRTYNCNNEDCEVVNSYLNNYLIYDDALVLFDPVKNTREVINTSINSDYENFSFEFMVGNNDEVYGITFTTEKVEDAFNSYGFKGGYYSLKEKEFTIPYDDNYIIKTIYALKGYDLGLMVSCDDKFGYYSLKNDKFAIEMTSEYTNISYDNNNELLELKTPSKDDEDEYFYTLYDATKESYKINVKKLECNEDAGICLYTTTDDESNELIELFNIDGSTYKTLPYYRTEDLIVFNADKKQKAIRKGDMYIVFNTNYKVLFKTQYENAQIYDYTSSYVIVNNDNELYVENGKTATDIMKICDLTDTISYYSSNENNKVLEIYVYDSSIENEDGSKSGIKYTLNTDNELLSENVKLEE